MAALPKSVTIQVNVDDSDASRRVRLLAAAIASAESRLESLEERLTKVNQGLAQAETAKPPKRK